MPKLPTIAALYAIHGVAWCSIRVAQLMASATEKLTGHCELGLDGSNLCFYVRCEPCCGNGILNAALESCHICYGSGVRWLTPAELAREMLR